MTADICISTFREGIKRLASQTLPRIEGVEYVVSWQEHADAPVPEQLAAREDVHIYRFDAKGQSHNRNNSLAQSHADISIISDDDLIYHPEGIRALIRAFEENPHLDVATFRSIHDSGIHYPDSETPLSLPLPQGYYASCFEIAVRRSERTASLKFNPELGLNSPRMHGGEDEVFLLSAIKRGLDVRFLPITLCEHPALSTGLRSDLTAENLRALGCVISLYYPLTAPLRIPLKAWRLSRRGQAGLLRSLFYMTAAALATPAFKRRTRQYLWP